MSTPCTLAIAILVVMPACGSDDRATPDAAAELIDVTVPFVARFGTTPFVCGTPISAQGTPPTTYTPSDLRFYLSQLTLIDDDGHDAPIQLEADAFQGNGVALLDFENGCGSDGTPALHTSITGKVTAGTYHRLRFTLGVPAELDHLDVAAATAPLDVTGMYWTWLFGYKFLKLDGSVTTAAAPSPFFLHLGSSGCPGDNQGAPPPTPCAYPNQVTYDLPGFDPKTSQVVADLGAVLATSDLSVNTPDTAPGCMSEPADPECVTVLPRIGVAAISAQVLFKVE